MVLCVLQCCPKVKYSVYFCNYISGYETVCLQSFALMVSRNLVRPVPASDFRFLLRLRLKQQLQTFLKWKLMAYSP